MYCGHSATPMKEKGVSKFDADKIREKNNASTITMGRLIAISVLVINLITLMISKEDPVLGSVCMLSALFCGAISFVLVGMSFEIDKDRSQQEIDERMAKIKNGAIIVLVFSGADFLVAVNSVLF